MNTLNKTLIALATGAVLSTTASAHVNTTHTTSYANGETYVGVKAGQFDVDLDNADNANAYGIYVGHEFYNGLGIEAEYVGSDDTDISNGLIDGEYNVKEYGLYGTYRHHFNNSPLYGKAKLGVAKAEIEANYGKVATIATKESDATGVAGGLGLGYDIGNNFTIEGEYDMIAGGDDLDANLWTIGAHYNF